MSRKGPIKTTRELAVYLQASDDAIIVEGLRRLGAQLRNTREFYVSADPEKQATAQLTENLMADYLYSSPECREFLVMLEDDIRYGTFEMISIFADIFAWALDPTMKGHRSEHSAHIARTLLQSHMTMVSRSVCSAKPQLVQCGVRLLTAFARHSIPIAKEFMQKFPFRLQFFANIPLKAHLSSFAREKVATKEATARGSITADDTTVPEEEPSRAQELHMLNRALYLDLVYALLAWRDNELTIMALKANDLVARPLQHLAQDSFETYSKYLTFLLTHVIGMRGLPLYVKTRFFNNSVLDAITAYYSLSTHHRSVAHKLVKALIGALLAHTHAGAASEEEDAEEAKTLRSEANAADELGQDMDEEDVAVAEGSSSLNSAQRTALLRVLLRLQANEDIVHQQLVLYILKKCPHLIPAYLHAFPYQFDPRASHRWVAQHTLLCKILHIDTNAHTLLNSPITGSGATLRLPTVLEVLVPPQLTKATLQYSLQRPSPMVRFFTLTTLATVLQKYITLVTAGKAASLFPATAQATDAPATHSMGVELDGVLDALNTRPAASRSEVSVAEDDHEVLAPVATVLGEAQTQLAGVQPVQLNTPHARLPYFPSFVSHAALRQLLPDVDVLLKLRQYHEALAAPHPYNPPAALVEANKFAVAGKGGSVTAWSPASLSAQDSIAHDMVLTRVLSILRAYHVVAPDLILQNHVQPEKLLSHALLAYSPTAQLAFNALLQQALPVRARPLLAPFLKGLKYSQCAQLAPASPAHLAVAGPFTPLGVYLHLSLQHRMDARPPTLLDTPMQPHLLALTYGVKPPADAVLADAAPFMFAARHAVDAPVAAKAALSARSTLAELLAAAPEFTRLSTSADAMSESALRQQVLEAELETWLSRLEWPVVDFFECMLMYACEYSQASAEVLVNKHMLPAHLAAAPLSPLSISALLVASELPRGRQRGKVAAYVATCVAEAVVLQARAGGDAGARLAAELVVRVLTIDNAAFVAARMAETPTLNLKPLPCAGSWLLQDPFISALVRKCACVAQGASYGSVKVPVRVLLASGVEAGAGADSDSDSDSDFSDEEEAKFVEGDDSTLMDIFLPEVEDEDEDEDEEERSLLSRMEEDFAEAVRDSAEVQGDVGPFVAAAALCSQTHCLRVLPVTEAIDNLFSTAPSSDDEDSNDDSMTDGDDVDTTLAASTSSLTGLALQRVRTVVSDNSLLEAGWEPSQVFLSMLPATHAIDALVHAVRRDLTGNTLSASADAALVDAKWLVESPSRSRYLCWAVLAAAAEAPRRAVSLLLRAASQLCELAEQHGNVTLTMSPAEADESLAAVAARALVVLLDCLLWALRRILARARKADTKAARDGALTAVALHRPVLPHALLTSMALTCPALQRLFLGVLPRAVAGDCVSTSLSFAAAEVVTSTMTDVLTDTLTHVEALTAATTTPDMDVARALLQHHANSWPARIVELATVSFPQLYARADADASLKTACDALLAVLRALFPFFTAQHKFAVTAVLFPAARLSLPATRLLLASIASDSTLFQAILPSLPAPLVFPLASVALSAAPTHSSDSAATLPCSPVEDALLALLEHAYAPLLTLLPSAPAKQSAVLVEVMVHYLPHMHRLADTHARILVALARVLSSLPTASALRQQGLSVMLGQLHTFATSRQRDGLPAPLPAVFLTLLLVPVQLLVHSPDALTASLATQLAETLSNTLSDIIFTALHAHAHTLATHFLKTHNNNNAALPAPSAASAAAFALVDAVLTQPSLFNSFLSTPAFLLSAVARITATHVIALTSHDHCIALTPAADTPKAMLKLATNLCGLVVPTAFSGRSALLSKLLVAANADSCAEAQLCVGLLGSTALRCMAALYRVESQHSVVAHARTLVGTLAAHVLGRSRASLRDTMTLALAAHAHFARHFCHAAAIIAARKAAKSEKKEKKAKKDDSAAQGKLDVEAYLASEAAELRKGVNRVVVVCLREGLSHIATLRVVAQLLAARERADTVSSHTLRSLLQSTVGTEDEDADASVGGMFAAGDASTLGASCIPEEDAERDMYLNNKDIYAAVLASPQLVSLLCPFVELYHKHRATADAGRDAVVGCMGELTTWRFSAREDAVKAHLLCLLVALLAPQEGVYEGVRLPTSLAQYSTLLRLLFGGYCASNSASDQLTKLVVTRIFNLCAKDLSLPAHTDPNCLPTASALKVLDLHVPETLPSFFAAGMRAWGVNGRIAVCTMLDLQEQIAAAGGKAPELQVRLLELTHDMDGWTHGDFSAHPQPQPYHRHMLRFDWLAANLNTTQLLAGPAPWYVSLPRTTPTAGDSVSVASEAMDGVIVEADTGKLVLARTDASADAVAYGCGHYDPGLILPIVMLMVNNGSFSTKQLVDSGLMAFALRCLSLNEQHATLRSYAQHILAMALLWCVRIEDALQEDKHRRKAYWEEKEEKKRKKFFAQLNGEQVYLLPEEREEYEVFLKEIEAKKEKGRSYNEEAEVEKRHGVAFHVDDSVMNALKPFARTLVAKAQPLSITAGRLDVQYRHNLACIHFLNTARNAISPDQGPLPPITSASLAHLSTILHRPTAELYPLLSAVATSRPPIADTHPPLFYHSLTGTHATPQLRHTVLQLLVSAVHTPADARMVFAVADKCMALCDSNLTDNTTTAHVCNVIRAAAEQHPAVAHKLAAQSSLLVWARSLLDLPSMSKLQLAVQSLDGAQGEYSSLSNVFNDRCFDASLGAREGTLQGVNVVANYVLESLLGLVEAIVSQLCVLPSAADKLAEALALEASAADTSSSDDDSDSDSDSASGSDGDSSDGEDDEDEDEQSTTALAWSTAALPTLSQFTVHDVVALVATISTHFERGAVPVALLTAAVRVFYQAARLIDTHLPSMSLPVSWRCLAACAEAVPQLPATARAQHAVMLAYACGRVDTEQHNTHSALVHELVWRGSVSGQEVHHTASTLSAMATCAGVMRAALEAGEVLSHTTLAGKLVDVSVACVGALQHMQKQARYLTLLNNVEIVSAGARLCETLRDLQLAANEFGMSQSAEISVLARAVSSTVSISYAVETSVAEVVECDEKGVVEGKKDKKEKKEKKEKRKKSESDDEERPKKVKKTKRDE